MRKAIHPDSSPAVPRAGPSAACGPDAGLPVVAIVGRPNVGKSSIFNRLTGRRTAIVHAERGVTRDRLARETAWAGRSFELVDTGGLGPSDEPEAVATDGRERLDQLVRRQVEFAVRAAAAVICVTDLDAGLAPQDEEAIAFLRRSGKPLFLAANKADDPARDAAAADFMRFGVPVFPVSAAHNRGFDALMGAVLAVLPDASPGPDVRPLRVAVVGRPNVGKSSLINRLLNSERLIVSAAPGTTRDSVEVPLPAGRRPGGRPCVLIDTAGMRRAGKIRQTVERAGLARATRSLARADIAALMLDATAGPTAQDKAIAGLIGAHHRGCLLLVNKWDLMRGHRESDYRAALARALPFLAFAPVVFVSARTGFNLQAALETVRRVADHVSARLPTGRLNRVLADAYARTTPPSVRGRRLKIFYATQAGISPLTLRVFVNHPGALIRPYELYLVNALRRAFDLEGAPLVLRWSPRPTPGSPHGPRSAPTAPEPGAREQVADPEK